MGLPALAGAPYPSVIPAGTQIQVRPNSPITVAQWDRGRIYPGHVVNDVFTPDGNVAIPAGSYCELIVRQIAPGNLAVDVESITVNGRRYVLDTTGPRFDTNRFQHGGGLVGGIVGAIAGATGGQVEYRGDHIRIPAGSMLTFHLNEPLHVVSWGDQGYMRNGYHYHQERDWYRQVDRTGFQSLKFGSTIPPGGWRCLLCWLSWFTW